MQSIPSQEKSASSLMDVNVVQAGARLEFEGGLALESPLWWWRYWFNTADDRMRSR